MGWLIGVKPERIEEYISLHANVWPEVLKTIQECNIRNYTIYLREPENLLFASFEYHGKDYETDMERMERDPYTQKWWALTAPCQEPIVSRKENEQWAPMREVFHSH